MKRIIFLLVGFLLVINISNHDIVALNDRLAVDPIATSTYGSVISFVNADKGVVSVFHNRGSASKVKLVVQKGTDKYVYNLFNNEEYVNYPLQLGDGSYRVSVYENTSGTKYRKIASKSSYVTLEDELNVYLQSILEISWKYEDISIELVNELVDEAINLKKSEMEIDNENELSDEEVIEAIYSFVIKTIVYDYDKINGLDYSYTPDNDTTLELEAGICYDYSSLLASMLRSVGVPSKMAKGYTNTSSVYHAWNEIYLSEEERWVIVDSTYDAYMVQNGFSYEFEKTEESYNKVKEF